MNENENFIGLVRSNNNIICDEKKDMVYPIDDIIISLFLSYDTVIGIINAKNYISYNMKNSRIVNYTFSYPKLGSITYNYNNINQLYDFVNSKNDLQLYYIFIKKNINIKIRINAIAAFIIRKNKYFLNLYDNLKIAIESKNNNKYYYSIFVNPYPDIIKTNKNTKEYDSEELIRLYNISKTKTFEGIFPIQHNHQIE